MKTRYSSLTSPQKENVINVHHILDNYFDFSNSDAKKPHIKFLIFEFINFLIIIFSLILFSFREIWGIFWISVFTVSLILSIILFSYKKSSFRFLSYVLIIFGLLSLIFIRVVGVVSDYFSPNPIPLIFDIAWLGAIIIDSLFLIYFFTIEYSIRRYMNPMYNKNNVRMFAKYGTDKLGEK